MARPTPVLPDVGSTIVPPCFRRPARSAASIMAIAGRSFTLPPALRNSSLASTWHEMSRAIRSRRTSGVLPARVLARPVVAVTAPDAWYLKRGATARGVRAALKGRSFTAARRIGKLLLLDTGGGGPTLGLHFGMSGRLVVDGDAGVDDL